MQELEAYMHVQRVLDTARFLQEMELSQLLPQDTRLALDNLIDCAVQDLSQMHGSAVLGLVRDGC